MPHGSATGHLDQASGSDNELPAHVKMEVDVGQTDHFSDGDANKKRPIVIQPHHRAEPQVHHGAGPQGW